MESFLSRYRNPLVLLAVVLAQMLGLAVQVRRPATGVDGHKTRLVRYWMVSLISPFERAFLYTGHGISNTWSGYLDLRNVRQQNQQLHAELNRMQLEQASLTENARQDLRLQKLFAFQQKYVSTTVAAHVLGTSGTDLSRVLYIDKGSSSGIHPDMPVITPDGVVGKTRDVFPHTAQVLEINDPTSGLGVILSKTRLRGILRGNTAGRIEIVDVLPDERIQPGEQVVTSGGDQIYPRGLPVGTVERTVSDPERNPYVAIMVRPAVNLSSLDEVLIITQTTTTMPTQMQKDLASSEQRAADILSERLPGASAPPILAPGQKSDLQGIPTSPPHLRDALHPDRFTPGDTPPASNLTPGVTYPKQKFALPAATSEAAAAASPSASTRATTTPARRTNSRHTLSTPARSTQETGH